MPDARLAPIVQDLVVAIKQLVEKHQITPEEYRAAVGFLSEAGQAEGAPFIERGQLVSEDEGGDRLAVAGVVRDVEGDPIADAVLDFWQPDAQGRYSGFDSGPREMNLRGRLRRQRDGSYQLHTVRPAAYTIPHEGLTGRMLRALGRHPWRPAHIHLKASHEGYRPITTQIYLADSEYLDSDAANAVRDDLVRPVTRTGSGYSIDFDVLLEPEPTPAG
jgi:catechol 1,2-dioxygenase